MKKQISLKEQLATKGFVKKNTIVDSVLVKELEVYGFLNSCKYDDAFTNVFRKGLMPNGIINKNTPSMIVSSSFMYQNIEYHNGMDITTYGQVFPIFSKLEICKKNTSLNVENIYIPSLCQNSKYREIKMRIGTGVNVTDAHLENAGFPKCIYADNGKAMFSVVEGDIMMKDEYDETKSIGEEVMVICRYINKETGIINYTIYNLDEVFTYTK